MGKIFLDILHNKIKWQTLARANFIVSILCITKKINNILTLFAQLKKKLQIGKDNFRHFNYKIKWQAIARAA